MSDDKYRQAFEEFDIDGDGTISPDELQMALRNAFGDINDSKMDELLAMKGNKECLDMDEFISFMHSAEACCNE